MGKEEIEIYFNLTNFIYSGMLDEPQKRNAYKERRELLANFPELKVIEKAFFDWEIKGADYPEIADFEYLAQGEA